MTRAELTGEFMTRLDMATRERRRVCFGQDHQYGVPWALIKELGLGGMSWRTVIDKLTTGSYGENAPPLSHPRTFGAAFNAWLDSIGLDPYFYSATKASRYGLPRSNPRHGDQACYRLTEKRRFRAGGGAPKPFNRVGDNGTVGGQSLLGILEIRALLEQCAARQIKVAVWPFDGLSVMSNAYAGAHVMIEPYPSAVRRSGVAQSDESDALACADHIRDADNAGKLGTLLDISGLAADSAAIALVEGWIASHEPSNGRAIG